MEVPLKIIQQLGILPINSYPIMIDTVPNIVNKYCIVSNLRQVQNSPAPPAQILKCWSIGWVY